MPTKFRVLGIDFGTRRVGLAYGDELGVAVPLGALVDAEAEKRWEGLGKVLRERRVEQVVVGLPLNMDGSEGFKVKEAREFAGEVGRRFGVRVHFVDERLTSQVAEAGMSQKELREIRGRGIVDSRAAALILQDWLDERVRVDVEMERGDEG